jgi:hypothetical protein
MFQLTDADKDILTQKKIVPRLHVSDKDPFMNRPRVFWRAMHRPVASTSEIMQSLEPYETRRATENGWNLRFNDQEMRYYRNEEEIKRNANINQNQKKQIEALSNPEEANKINRLKKELSTSEMLTEVPEDWKGFETVTNRHFNREMNKMQKIDQFVAHEKGLTMKLANNVVNNIKASLAGRT